MKRLFKFIFWLTSILAMTLIVAGYFYLEQIKNSPLPIQGESQEFTIDKGMTMNQLIEKLETEQLIDSPLALKVIVKLNPELANIKSGIYQLKPAMTTNEMLNLFTSNLGMSNQFSVQFIEGKIVKDGLMVLNSAENLTHSINAMSPDEIAKKLELETPLEGWLFPDTYFYTEGMSDFDMVKIAHDKMKKELTEIWEGRDEGLPYKTPYEMLIMASLIEKETGVSSERGKVASVFINRLRVGMKLQTDPTIIYGLGDKYSGRITSKNLKDTQNRYNTYVIDGLPPTPIAMPSKASLLAAAHPEKTPYFYFVADGNGGHTFSKNYSEHKKAVAAYWRGMRNKTQ